MFVFYYFFISVLAWWQVSWWMFYSWYNEISLVSGSTRCMLYILHAALL